MTNSSSVSASTNNTTTVTTYKTATKTTTLNTKITVNSVTLHSYEKYTIVATVADSDGNYVNSGYVAFKINGITIAHANVTNGKATITYTVPALLAKNYTVQVIYSGTDNLSSSTGYGTLSVEQYSTVAHVTAISGTTNSTITLRAVIKTTTGAFVKSGKVAFKINGTTIGTAYITNGVATLNYTIPSTWKAGTYTITVVYGETKIYNSCSGTGTLKISASSTVPSGYEKYLVATTNCQVNSATIQSIANKFANYTSAYDKAVAIFNYLNDATSYSYYSNTLYGAVGTWTRKSGNCVDLSHLLIAVMRAAGIPARYVHATSCTFNSGLVVGHVWAEVYVNGAWYTCDLTSSKNTFGVVNNWYKCSGVTRYITLPF